MCEGCKCNEDKKEDNKYKDRYKMFKQFMYNDLEISKEDIRVWIKESISDEIKKMLNNTYSNDKEWVEYTVKHEVLRNLGMHRNEIKRLAAEALVEKLDFSIKEKSINGHIGQSDGK